MNYSEAFEAVRNGDYATAASLLEQAATETDYASDPINQAYILALHRTGQSDRSIEVAFRAGVDAAEDASGLALDYFQRALVAGLDSARAREIGVFQERWAEAPSSVEEVSGPIQRVAHVLGELTIASPAARHARMLGEGLRSKGSVSAVFSTEWAVSWPFSLTGDVQTEYGDSGGDVWRASVREDFLQRARSAADAIRAFRPDIVFYHSTFFEQITARIAAFRPASRQIHINHGVEMPVDLFDGRVHLTAGALATTRYREVSAPWIPMASDIETRLTLETPILRQAIGIDSATSVSATFGDLDQICSPGYVAALTEILARFPDHAHLFAGSGNVRAMRQALHAEGVLPRVRFLGPMINVAPLLPSIDFYLAPFPLMDGEFVVEAMGAGKPVVIHRKATDPRNGSGSDLVAVEDLVVENQPSYVEAVSRIIRKPPVRAQVTEAVRARFQAEFTPVRLAERYLEFMGSLAAR